MKQRKIRDYNPGPLCPSCGKCCKSIPGLYWPHDFADLETEALTLLQSGKASIDYWHGDIDPSWEFSQIYYLRPATKTAEDTWIDASWGGECINLTEQGCSLPREERPTECKTLRPKQSDKGQCTQPVGLRKEDAVRQWRLVQDVMNNLVRKENQSDRP